MLGFGLSTTPLYGIQTNGVKMIKRFTTIFFILFFICANGFSQSNSPTTRKVNYIQGTIYEKSDEIIKLLDGSIWLFSGMSLALPMSDIIIILDNSLKTGIAYTDGDELTVTHIKGDFVYYTGLFTMVIKEMGDGALLQTDDGSFWEVPQYDRYDSGYWLPPYRALITSNELYLINLKKGKKIWVKRSK